MLNDQILLAVLRIRAEFNAAHPDMALTTTDLAGLLGEVIGTLCTFNDEGLEKILTLSKQQTEAV